MSSAAVVAACNETGLCADVVEDLCEGARAAFHAAMRQLTCERGASRSAAEAAAEARAIVRDALLSNPWLASWSNDPPLQARKADALLLAALGPVVPQAPVTTSPGDPAANWLAAFEGRAGFLALERELPRQESERQAFADIKAQFGPAPREAREALFRRNGGLDFNYAEGQQKVQIRLYREKMASLARAAAVTTLPAHPLALV